MYEYLATFIVPAILAGVWLVRLEGKVNTHEQVDNEKFDKLDERHDDIINRLKRIESKFDETIKLNGNGHGR